MNVADYTEPNEVADTHWHQGYRAHDANAPRTASERIPDANVRRQWLDGWDAAHATMQARARTKRTP